MPTLSAVVGELLLPFAPVLVAGLIAGYVGTPNGFWLAFLAGLMGSLASILWRHHGVSPGPVGASVMLVGVASWVLGTAVATGVCGWAGERLHARARRS